MAHRVCCPTPVLHLMCDRASPSFNRMSGITEFTNAVCLFVNVDSSNYSNTFYQRGRGMSHLGILLLTR